MSQREAAKQENRERIKDAAEKIIRNEGIEHLTMRHLADVAGVSLRTPYNLFGSKTDVLIALLEDASKGLRQVLAEQNDGLVVERLLGALDAMEAYFSADEEFYQKVYWAVMASDQLEIRRAGYNRIIALAQALVAEAVANKELSSDTDSDDVGQHLGVQLMSILGMWGAGFFDSEDCAAHIRRSWRASLLTLATRKSKPFLAG